MRHDQPRKNGASRGTHVVPIQSAADAIAIPFVERLTCTIAEACEATGLGRTKLYELIGQDASLQRQLDVDDWCSCARC
jgi:hypothetical protein